MIMHSNIIAEIAQGYEGNLELAKLLLRASAKAKADIVKFQMVYADDLATPSYEHYDLFRSLEFSVDQWSELYDLAKTYQVSLCVDVFGKKSVDIAKELGLEILKIHPTDINNADLLSSLNKEQYSIIVGIGGATLTEIKAALKILSKPKSIVLMPGYQAYPTPNDDNQVSRIAYLSKILRDINSNIKFGFADHVVNDENYSVALNAMAFAAGATYFEKHISLGNCTELEDFESALQPDQFAFFADKLRDAIKAYGITQEKDDFGMSAYEATYRKKISRSWVAARDLKTGSVLTRSDLSFKRTGDNEIQNLELVQLIGKKLKLDIEENHCISSDDLF